VCGAAFRLPGLLEAHMSLRHGIKREEKHHCKMCDARFASLENLLEHQHKMHDTIASPAAGTGGGWPTGLRRPC